MYSNSMNPRLVHHDGRVRAGQLWKTITYIFFFFFFFIPIFFIIGTILGPILGPVNGGDTRTGPNSIYAPIVGWTSPSLMSEVNLYTHLMKPSGFEMCAGPMLHSVKRQKSMSLPEALCAMSISANTVQATPVALSDITGHALAVGRRSLIGQQLR